MITSFDQYLHEAQGLGLDAHTPDDLGRLLIEECEKEYPDSKRVRELIDHGASLNVQDFNEGDTALHWATRSKDAMIVQMLIDAGAIVDIQNTKGLTALHLAAKHNIHEIAQILIDCGAYLNTHDVEDRTPLHWAAINGCYDVAMVLINAGASKDSCDAYGHTPWEYAAWYRTPLPELKP